MKAIALQSGSNGNSIFVEAEGVGLLFDAGISGVQAQTRLAGHGHDIQNVDALIISHDHSDHARCLGVYARKFRLPVHVTEPTLCAAGRYQKLGRLENVRHFAAGATLDFGRVRVETYCTPHDGADGVAFVVDDGSSRLGILTDLGHVFAELPELIATLDAVFLESNYDPALLASGSYPPWLKARIRGPGGHLSNLEAARLLADAATSRLRWACLSHLSEENNRPDVALATHHKLLGKRLPLHVAQRYADSGVMDV